jgi:hypothetical protein
VINDSTAVVGGGRERDSVLPIWIPNYTAFVKQTPYSKVPYDESHIQAFFDECTKYFK